MKTIHNTKIIGIDHGYGNMKTASCCFPTGITAYDHEPLFTADMLVYQCTLAVREAFMQKTQREINDAIIDEVLITGTANIAPADLKIIKGVAAEYVRDIFRRLREHGYDENTMTLYVTGGGGCLVKNFYKFNADRVKFIEDICAAAKGYEYLAEAQMKAEAKG